MDRFNLEKGDKFNLSKSSGNAKKFYVAIGWDTPPASETPHEFDVDVSVFGCKSTGDTQKIVRDDYFIFYNQERSQDGAIIHSGDNRTGAGDGDDEVVRIDTSLLDPACDSIELVADLHEAPHRGQHFGMAKNTYIRICKMDDSGAPSDELGKFKLNEDYTNQTGIHFGSLFKNDTGEWEFEAIGDAFQGGLRAAMAIYT